MIVYNGEAFLDEAIASVVRQSVDDWELIVADDGSSDASRAIVRRRAASDPRIRLVQHPDGGNHGMSATRNLGLTHARGEYIGFLDADDVWEPSKIEEQLEAFSCHPEAAMAYGRTLIWHSWDARSTRQDFYYDLGVPPNRVHPPTVLFRNLLKNVHQTPTTCNALVRRSAIQEVGGFEDSFPAMFEDQVFFAKILLRYPALVSDHSWARYRQHSASSSALSSADGADEEGRIRFLVWLRHYLSGQHEAGARERLALVQALARLRGRSVVRALTARLGRRMGRLW